MVLFYVGRHSHRDHTTFACMILLSIVAGETYVLEHYRNSKKTRFNVSRQYRTNTRMKAMCDSLAQTFTYAKENHNVIVMWTRGLFLPS